MTFSLTVNKANQSKALMFDLPESFTYGDAPFQIFGSGGSSNGAFSYFVTSGDAVAVSNTGMVTVLRPGKAVITAVKAGDVNFLSQTIELRINVNKGVQNALTISGIPARVVTGQTPFKIIASGGSGSGTLSYKVVSGNAVSVDENGMVTILKRGTALLSVIKAEDDYYLATMATAEIEVRTAVKEEPSASPTPSAPPTAVPSPTAIATPPPAATNTPSTQDDASASVTVKPLSIQTDEETGKMVVLISIYDLPEGTKAIRLLSGEIIQIDTTLNSLELSISRRDINEAGELVLVALNEEHIPMGSCLIDLSDDAWQNGTSDHEADILPILIWAAVGALFIGGAAGAIVIFLNKRK